MQPLIKFLYAIEGCMCQAITSQYKKAASVWYSDLRKVKVVLWIWLFQILHLRNRIIKVHISLKRNANKLGFTLANQKICHGFLCPCWWWTALVSSSLHSQRKWVTGCRAAQAAARARCAKYHRQQSDHSTHYFTVPKSREQTLNQAGTSAD